MTPRQAAELIEAFLDGSGGRWDWDDFTSTRAVDPRVEGARRRCLEISERYPPTLANEWCSTAGRPMLRTVATELRVEDQRMVSEANAIVADALEAEARRQDRGDVHRLREAYDHTYARVVQVNSDFGEAIELAFSFWDEWIDAATHDWHFHDPIKESDWSGFAQEIAVAVRVGRVPDNQFLIEQFRVKPRRTLRQKLWSLFGRAV
ncbi:MAG: hypothetical protein WBC51_12280 [Vicinamibacterales bacterium]